MNLLELQRRFNDALTTPLNSEEGISDRTSRGESMQQVVEEIVKPNDRLTSFERLEIYNRQYWFRIISAFSEDFPALAAVVGDAAFDRLTRRLGSRHPERNSASNVAR